VRHHRFQTAAAAVLVASLLGACAGSSSGDENPAGVTIGSVGDQGRFNGTAIDPAFALPDVTLQDTDERTVTLAEVMKPVTVVFFGYTNCPDVCNTQMAETASALRRMDDDARAKVGVVFITTDPARDDAATLRKYLDAFDVSFDTDFVGLTGDMDQIRTAADGLAVALDGKTKVPGGYEVGHGTQLIGFGPDRTGEVLWTVGTPVGELREDLTTLAEGA
jgi:protein SCO1/2